MEAILTEGNDHTDYPSTPNWSKRLNWVQLGNRIDSERLNAIASMWIDGGVNHDEIASEVDQSLLKCNQTLSRNRSLTDVERSIQEAYLQAPHHLLLIVSTLEDASPYNSADERRQVLLELTQQLRLDQPRTAWLDDLEFATTGDAKVDLSLQMQLEMIEQGLFTREERDTARNILVRDSFQRLSEAGKLPIGQERSKEAAGAATAILRLLLLTCLDGYCDQQGIDRMEASNAWRETLEQFVPTSEQRKR